MRSNPAIPRTDLGPRPVHPLADHHVATPVTIVILVGWLSHLGWPSEQIIAVLLVLLQGATAAKRAR